MTEARIAYIGCSKWDRSLPVPDGTCPKDSVQAGVRAGNNNELL